MNLQNDKNISYILSSLIIMNFKLKYIKYKNKYLKYREEYLKYREEYLKYREEYLKLKGGEIYFYDETLDDKSLRIIRIPYNPITDLKLIEMKKIKSDIVSNITSVVSNGDISRYINDTTQINWCLDPDTIYVNSPTNQYLFDRYKFIIYSAPLNTRKDGNVTDIISRYIRINEIPHTNLYDFILTGTIFGQQINFFNSIYSTILNNMVYDKILRWLTFKTISDPRYDTFIDPPIKKFILIKDFESKEANQIYFFTHKGFDSRDNDRDFKIHMNVKLKNIFYVLNVLLNNFELFEDCLNQFKISVDFPRFNVVNQFSNRSSDSFEEIDNGYIVEEEQPPNFVFYPEIDEDFIEPFNKDKVQRNVERIINILRYLFPDDLNLSSNLFPRMNFRLTDCIYFSIGDSGEKFDNPENFIAPTDYFISEENKKIRNYCHEFNKITKILSNHTLYDETNKCKNINVKQYRLLNSKKFNNYSSRDIYKMVGQEKIYNKLRFIASR